MNEKPGGNRSRIWEASVEQLWAWEFTPAATRRGRKQLLEELEKIVKCYASLNSAGNDACGPPHGGPSVHLGSFPPKSERSIHEGYPSPPGSHRSRPLLAL